MKSATITSSSLLMMATLLFIIISSASAILQSEANTFDWMKENVGRVKLVESGFSNKALSVVATNKAVLAGLSIRTGELIWRRVFNDDENIDRLYSIGNDKIASLSSSSSKRYVRVWNALDGSLLYDINSLSSSSDILSLGEKVIISTGSTLLLKDIKTGAEKWKVSSSNERVVFAKLVLLEKNVNAIQAELSADSNTISKLVVKALNTDSGALTVKSTIDLSSFSLTVESLNDYTGEQVIFKTTNKLIYFNVNTSESKEEDISQPEKISSSTNLDGTTYHASIQEQTATTIKIVVKKANDVLVQYDAPLDIKKHGKAQSIFFQLFKNLESNNNQLIHRFIVVTEDDSIIGFKENQQLWKREESLASVDEIKFVEFPVHHTVKSGNGVASFGNRISTQIVQATDLIQKAIDYVNALSGKKNNGEGGDESLRFVQDRLGFQKLVILKSKTGKILALHTSDGHLVWSLFIKGELEKHIDTSSTLKINLFITKDQVLKDDIKIRSQATIIVSDNKKSVAIVIDALNGQVLTVTPLPYVYTDAVLLPTTSEDRVHPLLLVDTELNVHIFPETKEIIQNVKSFPLNIHFHTRDAAQGKLSGYIWNVNQTKLTNTWSVSLNSPIVAFASPQALLNENIYTGIIVTASGNVLYKYLNPSMFAVATIEKEATEYPVLRVYVIDGTTGEVLHQIHNEDAVGPVNMVLDENTLVYQYTNAKQMRHELTTVELFNNGTDFQKKGFGSILMEKLFGSKEAGVFTSFGYSKPTSRKNTYILPFGVRSIGVTKTTIGVTNKQFILSLTNDQIYLVDKKIIDARRPRNPTAASDEIAEGLMPYNPYIPFVSLNVPTYNKPVSRVKHIQTSPSILESTTLMASSGLDVFFTRLSPSKKFDILNEDFSYAMLIISTSALFISVFVAKYLANKKEVQLKWSM
ncbi:hypothetical protein NAEGRDRAFT_78106 [Naegleria gruberi]|uniref:ER membrane protein complex subunit 1 n=1 Tax=Naegleria gruberi TaxID=5762 RepID=D2V123_NAEGR|nr:uncharacterized protein NAEGRDRAFT_78106 [Naegleria gruberi]EFC49614.1 hypothetical protein NAEGRDRAFT_78106 [Naegleria gruberi]|eukprot:XP_002682358.1 hypothetical protein NAEGRDRAFT_78106 [Naegleria gruberi strain NEG-M]